MMQTKGQYMFFQLNEEKKFFHLNFIRLNCKVDIAFIFLDYRPFFSKLLS